MNKLLVFVVVFFLALGCSPKDEIVDFESVPDPATLFEDPPQWSKEVVWYQIFVERFRNGDTTNDPTPKDMEGTYPGFVPNDWELTRWTQDWYQPDPYFMGLESGKDFYGNPVTSFGMKSQLRRYGGDLQGVLDQIEYIDSLGVTAIYFNPVNDAPSLHKYDARYWRHVDRNFGPDPKGDVALMESETHTDPTTWTFTAADRLFLKVIDEFHKRGIRVIMDYSWNHTGHTFWAWKDLVENQEESQYKDWYWVKEFDDPATLENEFEYKGWLGVFDLPEIKETQYMEHGAKLVPIEGNILLDEVKNHIFAITRRWMDPNDDGDPSDGVDGFRLDVAAEVPYGFWRDYRKVVRSINPEAYLVGEVWWEAWPDQLMDPVKFLGGDIFDAQMNYRWYRAARHFFNASPDKITVSEFVDSLNRFRSNLRPENVYAMMNLGASHDAPRVATSLFNKNAYKFNASPSEENDYKIHKPDEATYQTLKLLLAQQYTYMGSPHIWAGDEMGMWGADDPNCRKPLIWPDYEFEPETISLHGRTRRTDEVKFNGELFNYYRRLIQVREQNPVLKTGAINFTIIDDKNDVLAYRRFDEEQEVMVVFNNSYDEKTVQLEARMEDQDWTDVLNGYELTSTKDGVEISIAGRSSAILVRE